MSEHISARDFIYRVSEQVVYKNREEYTPEEEDFVRKAGLLAISILHTSDLSAIEDVSVLTGTPKPIVAYFMSGSAFEIVPDKELQSESVNNFFLYFLSGLNVSDIAAANQQTSEYVGQGIQNVIGLLNRGDRGRIPEELQERKIGKIKKGSFYSQLIHCGLPHNIVKHLVEGGSVENIQGLIPKNLEQRVRSSEKKYRNTSKTPHKRPADR